MLIRITCRDKTLCIAQLIEYKELNAPLVYDPKVSYTDRKTQYADQYKPAIRNYMKNPDRDNVSRLDALPNIGKAIAADLHLIGIDHPKKLIGMEPFKMYEDLCVATGKRHDPCVIDVFMSAVHFMEGGEPLPWWSFTQERKKHITQQGG